MRIISIGVVVVSPLFVFLNSVEAYRFYQTQIPNGNNVKRNGSIWNGVGHERASGSEKNNVFGAAFKAAGYEWTKELCKADSDSDGFTNGEELGDPDCMWKAGDENPNPANGNKISHPGFADSVPDKTYYKTKAMAASQAKMIPDCAGAYQDDKTKLWLPCDKSQEKEEQEKKEQEEEEQEEKQPEIETTNETNKNETEIIMSNNDTVNETMVIDDGIMIIGNQTFPLNNATVTMKSSERDPSLPPSITISNAKTGETEILDTTDVTRVEMKIIKSPEGKVEVRVKIQEKGDSDSNNDSDNDSEGVDDEVDE